MAAACAFVDLPDALLGVVMSFLSCYECVQAARTCTTLRRAFAQCRLASISVSLSGVFRRGRYSERPHWTADLVALLRLLRRPIFAHLESLEICLDTPCFEAEGSIWMHPEYRQVATKFCTVHTLVVRAEPNCTHPSPIALDRLLKCFPDVRTFGAQGLTSIGDGVLKTLLWEQAPIRRLALENCHFTDMARRLLIRLLVSSAFTDAAWPRSLESLQMTGQGSVCVLWRAMRALTPILLPLNLPPNLRHLDIHDTVDQCFVSDMRVSIASLPKLKEMVISCKCMRVLIELAVEFPYLYLITPGAPRGLLVGSSP